MQLRIEEIQLYWKFIQQNDFVLGLSVFTLFANNFLSILFVTMPTMKDINRTILQMRVPCVLV